MLIFVNLNFNWRNKKKSKRLIVTTIRVVVAKCLNFRKIGDNSLNADELIRNRTEWSWSGLWCALWSWLTDSERFANVRSDWTNGWTIPQTNTYIEQCHFRPNFNLFFVSYERNATTQHLNDAATIMFFLRFFLWLFFSRIILFRFISSYLHADVVWVGWLLAEEVAEMAMVLN